MLFPTSPPLYSSAVWLSSPTAGGPRFPVVRSQANSRNKQQPPGQGWSPAEYQSQPQLHEHLNWRAGFWKRKQKLLAQCRPPQAGPRSNMATVADVPLLIAAKCKGEACQITLKPRLLPYTWLPLQHFLRHGGGPAAHPGFCPSCTKIPWELHYKPDSLWKTGAKDLLPHQPNTLPLSTITTSFNPARGSSEVRRKTDRSCKS